MEGNNVYFLDENSIQILEINEDASVKGGHEIKLEFVTDYRRIRYLGVKYFYSRFPILLLK